MNDENLKKGKETQFRSGEEQAEKARKGGVASGRSRRKKSDIKKTIQAILDETYTDNKGEKKTGEEILAITLFKIATDKKHRQCIQAQRLIYELTGQDKTPEDRKRIKQALKLQEKEIELIQKKIDKDDDW